MPYIIAVLALVVVGVGFTLFQSQTQPSDITTDESTSSLDKFEDVIVGGNEEVIEVTANPESVTENEAATADNTPPPTSAITETTPTSVTTPTPTPTTPTYDYENGTYTSHISYRTPDGNYSMDVTLTISNDKVVASDISYDSKTLRDSYTTRFNKSYETYVTGKNLDSVSLSRVGGASLTSNAFNKAVADIKAKAST